MNVDFFYFIKPIYSTLKKNYETFSHIVSWDITLKLTCVNI